jgi:hypothetical protein
MQGDYQSLIDKFGDMDIEVLNIETFSISYEKSKHYDDWYQIYAIVPWATTLAPVKDLTLFPKLRKFVAAQEAFSLVDEELAMCRLPHSIAETRIITTTCAVGWNSSHAEITMFSRLQGLLRITLWMRYRLDDHFGREYRLGREFGWEEYEDGVGKSEDMYAMDNNDDSGGTLETTGGHDGELYGLTGIHNVGFDETQEEEMYLEPRFNDFSLLRGHTMSACHLLVLMYRKTATAGTDL